MHRGITGQVYEVRSVSYGAAPGSGEAGQACLVEALLQSGLALVLLAQREEAARERCCVALPFSQRAQVTEQGYGRVVITGVLRLDQRTGPLPRRLLPGDEVVEVPGVPGGLGRGLAGLLLAPALLFGLLACRLAVAGCLPQLGGGPG